MDKAKMRAKATGKQTLTVATTPRKSCLNPKNRLRYSFTVSGGSEPPSTSFTSPNCDTVKPYNVHATGFVQ